MTILLISLLALAQDPEEQVKEDYSQRTLYEEVQETVEKAEDATKEAEEVAQETKESADLLDRLAKALEEKAKAKGKEIPQQVQKPELPGLGDLGDTVQRVVDGPVPGDPGFVGPVQQEEEVAIIDFQRAVKEEAEVIVQQEVELSDSGTQEAAEEPEEEEP